MAWRAQAGPHACVRAHRCVCVRAHTCGRAIPPGPGRTRGSAHALLRLASRLLWQALSKPSVKTKELVLAGNNLAGNGALLVRRRRELGLTSGTAAAWGVAIY